MSVTEQIEIDERGIEQKPGRKRGSCTEMLQKCQKCGRWVYTLTDMTKHSAGYVCGGCVSRIIDKEWRERRRGRG